MLKALMAVLPFFVILAAPARGGTFNGGGGFQKASLYVEALKEERVVEGDKVSTQEKVAEAATGFIVRYSTGQPAEDYTFFVTARHLLDGASALKVYVDRSAASTGRVAGKAALAAVRLPLFADGVPNWSTSPSGADVAVVLLWRGLAGARDSLNAAPEASSATAPASDVASVWAGPPVLDLAEDAREPSDDELSDVFFCGYALGARQKEWVSAITRRCAVALNPGGAPGQESGTGRDLMIDCTPQDGDSGAPVFLRRLLTVGGGRIDKVDMGLAGLVLGPVGWNDMAPDSKARVPGGLGRVVPVGEIRAAAEAFARHNRY